MALTKALDIGTEARLLSIYSSDLDNYRRLYSMNEVDEEESFLIQFVAPKQYLWEEYRFYLLQESITKPLKPELYYRPDYVSYYEYGSINLWSLLLFINDIPTIEDFNVDNIKVPSKLSIMNLANRAAERKTLKEIVALYDLPPKPTPPLYSVKKSIPREIPREANPVLVTPMNVYFMRDIFTLSIVDTRNRYIDLTEEPIKESVELNIVGSPNYLIDKHYTMIRGKKGYNRLSWDPKKIIRGTGLVNIMTEGIQLEVKYSKKSRQ